jgi:hypothetical protein
MDVDQGSCSMDVSAEIGLDYDGEPEDTGNAKGISEEEENFLKAASASVVHQCISEFIDTTCNYAVCPHVSHSSGADTCGEVFSSRIYCQVVSEAKRCYPLVFIWVAQQC